MIFNTACASCHTLYGEGGKVGPDLTGGGRNNLDYLLENIVDPSAVVTADFRMSILDLKDGRVLNGLIAAKKNNKILGLFLFGTSRVGEFLEKGFSFISVGNDLHHVLTQTGAYVSDIEKVSVEKSRA